MSSKTIEAKLARIIQLIASSQDDLEQDKLNLARNPSFEPFQIFRDLDRSAKGYLDENDLTILLSSYKIPMPGRELDSLFTIRKDGIPKVTFQDFLRHLSPLTEPSLKNNFLSKLGRGDLGSSTKAALAENERFIAGIYQKECEYRRQLESEINSLVSLGSSGFEEAFSQITDKFQGFITLESISSFMRKHNYTFRISDFENFMLKIDENKKGQLTGEDFRYYLFPNGFTSASNYSSIGRDYSNNQNYQGSVINSISSPIRGLGNSADKNIRINENYIPSSSQIFQSSVKTSPKKEADPYTGKVYITGPDPKSATKMNRVELIRPTTISQEKPAYYPPSDNLRSYDANKYPIGTSPARSEYYLKTPLRSSRDDPKLNGNLYSTKVAAIKDNPIYQNPAQNYTANLESLRKNYSARARDDKDTRLATSTYLTKDYLNPAPSHIQQKYEIPATRAHVEYKNTYLPERPYTSSIRKDYSQGYVGSLNSRPSTQQYSRIVEDRKAASISPIRGRVPTEGLESKPYTYIVPQLPPRYDPYVPRYQDSLARPSTQLIDSYIKPEVSSISSSNLNPPPPRKSSQNPPYTSNFEGYASKLEPPRTNYNLQSEPYSKYSNQNSSPYIPSRTINPPSTYQEVFKKNSELNEPSRDIPQKDLSSGILRESRIGASRDVSSGINRETPYQNRAQEGARQSATLDNYGNEGGRRSYSLPKTREDNLFGKEGGLASKLRNPTTELYARGEEQPSGASSYRFANQKYEQLWSLGSDLDS